MIHKIPLLAMILLILLAPTTSALDVATEQARVQPVWTALWQDPDGFTHEGVTGKGQSVLRRETADVLHPDLSDCTSIQHNQIYGIPSGGGSGAGHGTRTTGVLCGNGAMSDGKYRGVAFESRVFAGNNCLISCPHEEWYHEHNHRIATFSTTGNSTWYMQRWGVLDEDILYTNSAGNNGGDGSENQVTCHAAELNDPRFLCVAAANAFRTDVAHSSSRGDKEDPSTWPTITAPACVWTPAIQRNPLVLPAVLGYYCYWQGPNPGPDPVGAVMDSVWYQRVSGTSMASPFVAGVAGLMFQVLPDLPAVDARYILTRTADPFMPTDGLPLDSRAATAEAFREVHGYKAGYGYVNATAAVAATHYLLLHPDATPEEAVECFTIGWSASGQMILNPEPGPCAGAAPDGATLNGLVPLVVLVAWGMRRVQRMGSK